MSVQDGGAARRLGRTANGGGTVIPFPGRPPDDKRLVIRDRIALLDWADRAAPLGIARVAIAHWEAGDDSAGVGDFALIYRRGADWARWCLACSAGRYQLWETARNTTLGVFPALAAALACVEEQAARVSRLSTPARQGARGRSDGAGTDARAPEAAGRKCAGQ